MNAPMLVHQPTNSLLLKVPDPFAIRELLSNSRALDHPNYNVAVHHTLEAAKVLKNLGFDAPAPIRFQYRWPGKHKPFAHQVVMAEFLTMHRRGFNLGDMGVGKTYSSLWAADWLMDTGRVDKALVLAPLSTLERVWRQDIFDTLMHRTCTIVHGTRDKRKAALAADVDFYIMNHDGLGITEIVDIIFKRPDINLIIVDEGSLFRNSQTRKWKALEKLCSRHDVRLWWMTGTPCPNEPTDAWAQARLVSPDRVPKFPGHFKRQTMMQISQFKWVPRNDGFQAAFNAMQPAVRFKKVDCLDLPPVTVQDRQCDLSKEQRDSFETLRKTMVADMKDGKQIQAANAADQINKARQILCIAKDTPVLTHRGWVPIQAVSKADLIWDGMEWVLHKGLVEQGVKAVVECCGVRMTADHLVLTQSGWRAAQEINSGDDRRRFDRAGVWLPDSIAAGGVVHRQEKESGLAVSLCLRSRGDTRGSEPSCKEATERKALRLQAHTHQPHARDVVHATAPHLDTHDPSLLLPRVQGLQALGCARNYRLQSLAPLVSTVLAGHERRVHRPANAWSNRQRRRLRAGQLPMGDSCTAGQQYARQPLAGYAERATEFNPSSRGLRDVAAEAALAPEALAVDRRADQAVTYDIRDCGPRNRFVVRDRWGEPLIVHNCGSLKVGNDDYQDLDHKPRFEVLKECIEEASAKVLVVAPFKGIVRALEPQLIKAGWSVGVLNGDVSPGMRSKIINDFKSGPDPHILLCHPKVMSHGLNLTEADTLIFYAPIYSNDEYQQVTERFNRAGQKNKMTIIRMASHSLEWSIFSLLANRQSTQTSILDLYRVITE